MISRRDIFKLGGFVGAFSGVASAFQTDKKEFKGKAKFEALLAKAEEEHWAALPIGRLMGHVGEFLLGTPYVGFTLELSLDEEICSINLDGLDCVTFFESALDFSRMLILGGRTPAAMLAQVALTRYRGGDVGDFTSRLHYTTDWIYDNDKKKVVKSLTESLPGAIPFTQKVGIMSHQPNLYRQLKAHPNLVHPIKKFEDQINARHGYLVPMDKVEEAEKYLQTGDIIGVATNEPGIDIAHTGLIFKDDAGIVRFMDASSAPSEMKVSLEGPLHQAIRWSVHNTGIVVARPLEPKPPYTIPRP